MYRNPIAMFEYKMCKQANGDRLKTSTKLANPEST